MPATPPPARPEAAERILCTPREQLPPEWLPRTGSCRISWDRLLATLEARDIRPRFFPRNEVEKRPDIKQWIPYVLLRRADGCVACYPRQGSEKRLHGLWSVGIGGHVNAGDWSPDRPEAAAWEDILEAGMRREVAEELAGFALPSRPRCLGLIHEDATPVGSVHLGIACVIELPDGTALQTGRELEGMIWLEPATLLREHPATRRLEMWSVLALALLD